MSRAGPRLPDHVGGALADAQRALGLSIRLWAAEGSGWTVAWPAGQADTDAPGPHAVEVAGGPARLRVEVEGGGAAAGQAAFISAALERLLCLDQEAARLGQEIAERYEEITLLYSISEILGSVISLGEAAGTILEEVAGVLGVRRASLWVHDEEARQLRLVAAVGGDGQPGPIDEDDAASVTAAVYRSRRSVILDPEEVFPRPADDEPPTAARGSFLSVPVSYTPPEGESRTIGVINLIGRTSGDGFSAGDQKLITAIASQIGAAIENSRLVSESLRRERLVREMELAHDLQLKLLPSTSPFDDEADVAARCIPADSVGGDFYQLFRLPEGRIGVMIGDVSSHGFGAALIMALTMSAAAIHASEGHSPAEVLRRAHRTLIDELENTEMYLTLFYGVIDPAAGLLTYSNAGHAHAFRVADDGGVHRLGTTNPPFGLVDLDAYLENTLDWSVGSDLLCLFTDGLPDSLGMGEVRGEKAVLEEVARGRHLAAAELLDRIFAAAGDAESAADDRTAVVLRV